MYLYSFPKHYQTSSNEHELPKDDANINAERPSVRNKKAGAFRSEKHPEVHVCLKCNNVNCLSNCLKSSCKCTNSGENHSAAHKGCPSFKLAISKLLDRQ